MDTQRCDLRKRGQRTSCPRLLLCLMLKSNTHAWQPSAIKQQVEAQKKMRARLLRLPGNQACSTLHVLICLLPILSYG